MYILLNGKALCHFCEGWVGMNKFENSNFFHGEKNVVPQLFMGTSKRVYKFEVLNIFELFLVAQERLLNAL